MTPTARLTSSNDSSMSDVEVTKDGAPPSAEAGEQGEASPKVNEKSPIDLVNRSGSPIPSPSPLQTRNVDHDHEPDHENDPSDPTSPSYVWPSTTFSPTHELLFCSLVSMAQLLTQAGLAISIIPLHQIGAHYGITNPGTLSWLPAAYSLTVGTFILPAGRIGDLMGHRKMFVVGWVWYGIWCIVGGCAWYSNHVLQGIGPAILLPSSLAILGRTYAPNTRRKEMVFSLYGATAPNGFLVGGVFIALFTQFTSNSWAWGYWVMGIVCLICAVLTPFVIPEGKDDQVDRTNCTWAHFDIPGSLAGILALVLINFSWNQGAVVGWPQAYVYVCLILGILSFIAFIFIESRAPFPLLPIKQLNREIILVLSTIAAGWGSFGIWIFYLVQMLQVLRFESPLLTIAHMAPVGISGAIAAFTSGFLISRIRPPMILLASMCAFCTANILLATMPVNQIYWAQTFVSAIVAPWGMDMSYPSASILLSDKMPREHQGLAASLVNTAINYSISIALGVAGTIESRINPDGTRLLEGYRSAWYFAIGVSGLSIAISAIMILEHIAEEKKRKEVVAKAEDKMLIS